MKKFLPFLEDLRRRLYRGVILFIVVFIGGFSSTAIILKRVLSLVDIEGVVITTSSPFQFANVAMDVGFFLAIIVSVPYIVYNFYAFAAPALTRNEKIKLLKSVPLGVGLFIAGFFYGLFMLYYALGFLAAINTSLGLANFWNLSQFLAELLVTSALLGLVFEFPIILSLLIKLGIITPQLLKKNRRAGYFLIIALVALLPPTDGISLIAMTLPLVLLYEGTIFFNTKYNKLSTDQLASSA